MNPSSADGLNCLGRESISAMEGAAVLAFPGFSVEAAMLCSPPESSAATDGYQANVESGCEIYAHRDFLIQGLIARLGWFHDRMCLKGAT